VHDARHGLSFWLQFENAPIWGPFSAALKATTTTFMGRENSKNKAFQVQKQGVAGMEYARTAHELIVIKLLRKKP
jgi:hypothetical protein